MTLIERITAAIHECESQEQRANFNHEVVRWKTIKATLLDARDELQRQAPIVPKRDTLTISGKAAA